MELLFKDVRDVEWFQSKLSIQSIPYHTDSSVLYTPTLQLSFDHRHLGWDGFAELITSYIHERKRLDWVLHIIQEIFLYSDESEIERIFSITDELMTGEREDLLPFVKNRFDVLLSTDVISILWSNDDAISLDATLSFRSKPYIDSITQYVEVAIDEYKMEQEYQNYLEWLRNYFLSKETMHGTIHVTCEGAPLFFDKNGLHLSEKVLQEKMDRRLMSHHPVYVDSQLIAPLLSLSPEAIYVYTDGADSAIMRTCAAIFQDRLSFKSLESFPFACIGQKASI